MTHLPPTGRQSAGGQLLLTRACLAGHRTSTRPPWRTERLGARGSDGQVSLPPTTRGCTRPASRRIFQPVAQTARRPPRLPYLAPLLPRSPQIFRRWATGLCDRLVPFRAARMRCCRRSRGSRFRIWPSAPGRSGVRQPSMGGRAEEFGPRAVSPLAGARTSPEAIPRTTPDLRAVWKSGPVISSGICIEVRRDAAGRPCRPRRDARRDARSLAACSSLGGSSGLDRPVFARRQVAFGNNCQIRHRHLSPILRSSSSRSQPSHRPIVAQQPGAGPQVECPLLRVAGRPHPGAGQSRSGRIRCSLGTSSLSAA
jgi:hypothetical protein